jgi:DNA-binding MarR family transcriptional regulator
MLDIVTGRDAAPKSPPNVETFAKLVAGMSRFLSGLSRAEPFADATIGLAEWSALAVLAKNGGISNGLLAKLLGVTNQRATQITESLKNAGLITISQASNDSRKNVITIGDAGKEKLDAVNLKLEPILETAIGKNVRSLSAADRIINRRLMSIVKKRVPRDRRKGAEPAETPET